MGNESAVSPGGVKGIPGDLHLLSGPFVQVLQAANQLPLDRRRLPLHGPAGRLSCPSGAAESRESVGNTDAGGTEACPSERAAAEYLGEDLLGAPRVEAEPVGASAGGVRGGGGRGRAGFEAVLAVLVVDGALLRVAEHLREKTIEREQVK